MGFSHAAIAGLVIVALGQCASRTGLSSPDATKSPATTPLPTSTACSRPIDRDGRSLYETIRGAFVERLIDPGGAHVIVMKPTEPAANQSILVTPEVYEAAASVERGWVITLFAYVISADSGAHPPYSCIEL